MARPERARAAAQVGSADEAFAKVAVLPQSMAHN